jgi:VWFA-related protein
MINGFSLRSNTRVLARVALCVLAGGRSVHAQTAANQSEISTHDTTATFTARVNLVMVPVVVRDRQGHAVGTLEQADFQLFDKGKPQIISKFSVEKSGGKPAGTPVMELHATTEDGDGTKPASNPKLDVPTRFVAYLFDDLHTEFADLAQVRLAAAKHLAETLQPTDRAAIYTTSGIGMLDFTDDMEKIREALVRIQPHGRAGPASANCPPVTYYMADLIVNKSDPGALQVAEQDAIVCANIIVTSPPGGGPPPVPAQAVSMAQAAASAALSFGENDTKTALSLLKDVVRRMSASPGQRTIVLVSPGFFIPDYLRQDEIEVLDRAIRANVIISSLDARGLYVTGPGSDITERQLNLSTQRQKDAYQRDNDLVSSGTLAELADGTGGTLFHNNNDLVDGFRRVAAAPEFIYILGFSPQNMKLDGSYHALKVTLKNPRDVNLQARHGYYAPRHAIDPVEQAKQEIREAVFSREEMLDIPLDIQTQFFKSSDIMAKLAVVAKVDIKNLHYRKADGRNNDTLVIVSGVFDRNGNLVSAVQKSLDMHLKDETLENRLASGISLKTSFDVTPGSYVIRVVVRDQEGQLMAARNGVIEIP